MSKDAQPRLLLPLERLPVFESLSASECKKILLALMRYYYQGEMPADLSEKLSGIFLVLKSDADADKSKYQNKCERNRQNALIRSQKADEDSNSERSDGSERS